MIHRILHGHKPEWYATGYDFFTWEYKCKKCETQLGNAGEK